MKTLILDYSKWRCGKEGPYKVGEGYTMMKNTSGFMCCLGQFTPQLNPSISENNLLDCGYPSGTSNNTKQEIPLLTVLEHTVYYESVLSNKAVLINDNEDTTPLEKILSLRELFKEHDCEIEVINAPEEIMSKL